MYLNAMLIMLPAVIAPAATEWVQVLRTSSKGNQGLECLNKASACVLPPSNDGTATIREGDNQCSQMSADCTLPGDGSLKTDNDLMQFKCWDGEPGEEMCTTLIHSWTAQTWTAKQNVGPERNEEPSGSGGIPRSAQGKVMLLTAAKDGLLHQIESRVAELGNREGRGSKGMGSKEGALITISLLTFAVYLIKLVMMLINAVHAKKATSAAQPSASTMLPSSQQTFVLRPSSRSWYQHQEHMAK